MNIIKSNGEYSFFNDIEIINHLPIGNYTVTQDLIKLSFSLRPVEDFKFPNPYYEMNDKLYSYIEKSFKSNDSNLGVLLSGLKGNGKSVAAKMIAKKSNLPVIMIKEKISQKLDLFGFLSKIQMSACILIDEFEKIFEQYEDDGFYTQSSFLSYMDGAVSGVHKRLFVFTANGDVNDFLINRPSRIKFHKDFSVLESSVVDMVIKNELKNKDFEQDLRANIDSNFNLDLLMTIIRDINMLNAPFSDFKDVYNYKPCLYSYTIYTEILPGEKEDEEAYTDDDSVLCKDQPKKKIIKKDGKKWMVRNEMAKEKYSHDRQYINRYPIVACITSELFSMKYITSDGREIVAVFQDKV